MQSPYEVCAYVLAHAVGELAKCGRAVTQTIVVAGGIVVDSCDGGFLAVAPERVYRATTPFPTEYEGDDDSCSTDLLAVDLVLLLQRCVPVLTSTGNVPPLAEQEGAYKEILEDAAIMWRAMTARALTDDTGWLRARVTQTFVEPLGGCGGVETRLSIGMPITEWCLDCPEDEGSL